MNSSEESSEGVPFRVKRRKVVSGRTKGSSDFAPLNFRSTVNEDDLTLIRYQYQVPSEFQLEVPGPGDRICFPPEGRIGVYEECFRAGLRFPLHAFFVDLFSYLDMAPSSVVPNSWRYICGFTAACFLAGVEPSVALFRAMYTLARHQKFTGWCYITPRKVQGSKPLIRGTPTAVHGWKERFLFVSRSSGEGWGFSQWGEPSRDALRRPSLEKGEEEGLAILLSYPIPALDELLSERTLFNVGISSSGPQGGSSAPADSSGRSKREKLTAEEDDNESSMHASAEADIADVVAEEGAALPARMSPSAMILPTEPLIPAEVVQTIVEPLRDSGVREDLGLSVGAVGASEDDPAAPVPPVRDPTFVPTILPTVEAPPSSSSIASELGELRSMYEVFEELLQSSGPSGSQKGKASPSFFQLNRSIHGFLKYAVDSHARVRRAKRKATSETKARKAAEAKATLEAEAKGKAEERASKAEAEARAVEREKVEERVSKAEERASKAEERASRAEERASKAEERASKAEAGAIAERERAELELSSARALTVKSDGEARAAREDAAVARKDGQEKISQLETDLAIERAKSLFLEDQQQKQLTAAASDAVATYRHSEGFRDDLTTYSAGAFLAGKDEVRDRLHVRCPDFDFSLLDSSSDSDEDADLPASKGEARKE